MSRWPKLSFVPRGTARTRGLSSPREATTDQELPTKENLQRRLGNQATMALLSSQRDPEHPTVSHRVGFLDPADLHSPPASGPGSRGEPLPARSTQSVATLQVDRFYRSSVNPHNPVLLWTDGTRIFFSPSQEQVDSGRTLVGAEPTLAVPDGYAATDILWDRRSGLTTGGGALLVRLMRSGEPDIEITVSNTLEQRTHFAALGGHGSFHATRQDAHFISSDETRVSLGISGAAASGAIHSVAFPDGYLRYKGPTGSDDIYVDRASQTVRLVERATGAIRRTFRGAQVEVIVAGVDGTIALELAAGAGGTSPRALQVDLRTTPATVTSTSSAPAVQPGYQRARAGLVSKGVRVRERGLRFDVAELEAIDTMLSGSGGRGLRVLSDFRSLEGQAATSPVLEITKRIGPDDARGFAERGLGTPMLMVSEPFDTPVSHRRAAVNHEMTHVLMGATDAVEWHRMNSQQRADRAGAMSFEARRGRGKARAGLLRADEVGRGDRAPAVGSWRHWRGAVAHDPTLAAIWVELLRRYSFIQDPEGTGELRGTSLADESRYSGASEITSGHPQHGVGEFVASFTACAMTFPAEFRAAVLAAEAAGNARGGRGGSYVRSLYRRAWNRIKARYSPLGANPF